MEITTEERKELYIHKQTTKMETAGKYIKDFLGLFYPRLCNGCRRALLHGEECICSFCRFELPETNLHKQRENTVSRVFWGRADIETATSLFYFQKGSKVQNLIHQFKYKGRTEVGDYMGRVLGNQLKNEPLWEAIDLVVAVPLHPVKQHKRGFNQSEVFARGISETFKRQVENNNLVRITKTDTQTRKNRFNRWENVESVFFVSKPERLHGRNILLVDDVITTGSTLEACTQKLKAVKGVRVWIASIAITV